MNLSAVMAGYRVIRRWAQKALFGSRRRYRAKPNPPLLWTAAGGYPTWDFRRGLNLLSSPL